MSATSVPGFRAIPKELLDTPKPCFMTGRELLRTLDQLEHMGLIEFVVDQHRVVRVRPTARGVRIMRRSA